MLPQRLHCAVLPCQLDFGEQSVNLPVKNAVQELHWRSPLLVGTR